MPLTTNFSSTLNRVENSPCNKWPKISIHVEHGDWDRENEKCVDGKGWCRVRVKIGYDMTVPKSGSGVLWYENGQLNWVIVKDSYENGTFNELFNNTTYLMKNDIQLPYEVCDALKVDRGYTIKAGLYRITSAGEGYRAEDKKVIF